MFTKSITIKQNKIPLRALYLIQTNIFQMKLKNNQTVKCTYIILILKFRHISLIINIYYLVVVLSCD